METLHRIGQPEGADDLVLRAGGMESGAGDRDDMRHIGGPEIGVGPDRSPRSLDEQPRGLTRVEVVAYFGAGGEQPPGSPVEEDRIGRVGCERQLIDHRVPGVDP